VTYTGGLRNLSALPSPLDTAIARRWEALGAPIQSPERCTFPAVFDAVELDASQPPGDT